MLHPILSSDAPNPLSWVQGDRTMMKQSMFDLGFGYCRGDKYQRPMLNNGRAYCPCCGERMRQRARAARGPVARALRDLDSRAI